MKILKVARLTAINLILALLIVPVVTAQSSEFQLEILPPECTYELIDDGSGTPTWQAAPEGCDEEPNPEPGDPDNPSNPLPDNPPGQPPIYNPGGPIDPSNPNNPNPNTPTPQPGGPTDPSNPGIPPSGSGTVKVPSTKRALIATFVTLSTVTFFALFIRHHWLTGIHHHTPGGFTHHNHPLT